MWQRETQLDKLGSLESIKLIVDALPGLLHNVDELQDIKTELEGIVESADITADVALEQLNAQIDRVKESVAPKDLSGSTTSDLLNLLFSSAGFTNYSNSELIAKIQKISPMLDQFSDFLEEENKIANPAASVKINDYVLGGGAKKIENHTDPRLALAFLLVYPASLANHAAKKHLLTQADTYGYYYDRFKGELESLSEIPDNYSLLNTFYASLSEKKQGAMLENAAFNQAWKGQIDIGNKIGVPSLAEADAAGPNIMGELITLELDIAEKITALVVVEEAIVDEGNALPNGYVRAPDRTTTECLIPPMFNASQSNVGFDREDIEEATESSLNDKKRGAKVIAISLAVISCVLLSLTVASFSFSAWSAMFPVFSLISLGYALVSHIVETRYANDFSSSALIVFNLAIVICTVAIANPVYASFFIKGAISMLVLGLVCLGYDIKYAEVKDGGKFNQGEELVRSEEIGILSGNSFDQIRVSGGDVYNPVPSSSGSSSP
ncbi:MAG: hypothetical protein HON78_05545 [Legionellales bacterium]|nr:hypothetical protein [Legionellales bacterium]